MKYGKFNKLTIQLIEKSCNNCSFFFALNTVCSPANYHMQLYLRRTLVLPIPLAADGVYIKMANQYQK
jgi:hypothetical protein